MAQISAQKLISLARRGNNRAPVKSKRRRRVSRDSTKKLLKKAAFGTAAGMAISVPLTYFGRRMNQPLMIEAGQRIGSVASTAVGGTPGNAAYQTADAIFDRVLVMNGNTISGSQGQVYL